MRRGSLLWTFFPPLLIILVLALVLVTGFAGRAIRQFHVKRTAHELEALGEVTAPRFDALVAAGDGPAVQNLARDIGKTSGSRITIVLPDGVVLGDSQENPAIMDNHATRPEIAEAMNGGVGRSTRFSSTLGHRRMYVAVPAGSAEHPFVVRTSVSLQSLTSVLRSIFVRIVLIGLALCVIASLTSYLVARNLSRSLKTLQVGAEGFAAGDLSGRLSEDRTTEISAVAGAMNLMAQQLGERIATIEQQRNEREAILASMVEGVLAVDVDENVIGLNGAGAHLLAQNPDRVLGRSVQEIGRNPDITNLTQEILGGEGPLEKDIMLSTANDRWLQVHATGLVGADGNPIGALLVMNDVTRLRRLENMRRDFVANVSHELKTPITSIKGFVETLIEDPPENREELERFLGIVNNQADRLASIITDLLALSRLEKYSDNGGIEIHSLPLHAVLERVVRDLETRNRGDASRVRLQCPADLRARINPPLLEQAVGNLLENALKYSPADTEIEILCQSSPEETVISVRDHGPGIAPEHLPRLFERFYRVDKARSRRMGGTGLGLAIVKHIVQAHRGRVTVESEPGTGSTFTINLPGEDLA